jgi:hypothetical protein
MMMSAVRVRPAEPVVTATGFRISCALTGLPDHMPDELWFVVDSPAGGLRPPRTADFAACAMLPAAMALNAPLIVEGPVGPGLVRNLLEYQDAWSIWCPDIFSRVSITGDSEAVAPRSAPEDRGAVLAFSGGLDASFALIGHATGLFGARSSPVSLATMVQGFDIPLTDDAAFARAAGQARRQLADPFDIPLATVRTNWQELSVDWEMTHAIGLAAVLHLFDGVASRGIFAADNTYADIYHWGSNPVTNHLLGGGAFPVICSGFGYARTEKAAAVSRWPGVAEGLRVCWEGDRPGENCGRCEKCVRTQLNFLAAGVAPPSCLGQPVPELVRALQAKNRFQYLQFEDLAVHRESFPGAIRGAFDEMLARERRRVGERVPGDDPTGSGSIGDCRARCVELEESLHAVVSSRRFRLMTAITAPVDRARALHFDRRRIAHVLRPRR